jgi:hypothetical protein
MRSAGEAAARAEKRFILFACDAGRGDIFVEIDLELVMALGFVFRLSHAAAPGRGGLE